MASSGDGEGVEAEWVGVFAVDDTTHTWLMQKTGTAGSLAYADPEMRIVFMPTATPTEEGMEALEAPGKALIAGEACPDAAGGDTLTIAADGSCYNLVLTEGADDTKFTLDTAGLSGLVVLAQHFPTEFERDTHYLYDTAETSIEPVAQEGGDGHDHGHGDDHGDEHAAPEEPCSCMAAADGFKIDCDDVAAVETAFDALKADGCSASEEVCDAKASCQKNYRILQSHHDHCPHDTLSTAIEQEYHDFEEACNEHGCLIVRKFVEGVETCPTVDCENQVAMQAAADALVGCETDCTSAKCSLAFKTVHAFHDDCTHEDLDNDAGAAIEHEIHEFEEVCSEESGCNVVPEAFDPNICDADQSGAASLAASLFSAAIAVALAMV